MDYYVYVHKKKTNGEVFYVGKGSGKRAWSAFGRNNLWERTADKYGWYVEIVEDNLQGWYAFELEMNLISLYGRRDLGGGPLTNLSDGGDGPSRLNPEARRKISEAQSGLKHHKADRTIYSFYNFLSKDNFLGTRVDFENKYNLAINGLFSSRRKGVSSHFGWVVLDHLPEDTDLDKLTTKTLEGINNPNYDSNIYTFLNLETSEKFLGTKYEFQCTFNIKSAPMFYTGKTSKGWVVYIDQSTEKLEKLRFPSKEENNANADATVYTFSHKDGRGFVGTRVEFIREHGFSPYHLFTKIPSKVQLGWYLSKNKSLVNKSKRCQKVYNWKHEVCGDFSCTREQLETMYNLDTRPLFTTSTKRKSVKGWSLSQRNNLNNSLVKSPSVCYNRVLTDNKI